MLSEIPIEIPYRRLRLVHKIPPILKYGSAHKYWGAETNIKKQPFGNVTDLVRGWWHRQKDKNRSPSAKNQISEIRLSESANKKIPQSLLHWQMRWFMSATIGERVIA